MKTTIRLFPTFFMFLCLSAMPIVHAVSPAPDGGYPSANTAEGQNALFSLTTGSYNTAVGWLSLRSDTTGSFNTAIGAGALAVNSADDNTATGVGALLNNTTGAFNTANGVLALFHNTQGDFNTGIGSFVLFNNTTGAQNMAMGDSALLANTSGSQNIAIGVSALRNSNASHNVAIGKDALLHNNTGIFNVAIGESALQENTSANGNTAIGNDAGVNITGGGFNICIGSEVGGAVGDNNTIRIGDNLPTATGQSACYIGGIYGQLYGPNGTQCYVDPNGKLSVFFSARRFKTDIADMGTASQALLALRPLTFHYKAEFDKTATRQFGLVAEDVAAVNPDLVTRDAKGQLATVRYEAVNAMLLNEFLKEHRKVEKLEATVVELSSRLDQIAARIKMNDSAAHVAVSNQ
jgi:hypothetical protein